jgi:hypothetical protein
MSTIYYIFKCSVNKVVREMDSLNIKYETYAVPNSPRREFKIQHSDLYKLRDHMKSIGLDLCYYDNYMYIHQYQVAYERGQPLN